MMLAHTPTDNAYEVRRWGLSLLFTGFLSAFLGIFFATYLGYARETTTNPKHELNPIGLPWESGRVYFPATVSEMVSDPKSASGKCFLAFMSISSFSIMFSGYHWLPNVNVGESRCFGLRGCCLINYARALVPSIGLLLVANIYMATGPDTGRADAAALWIHTIGAQMFIGGYGLLEAHCLWCAHSGTLRISSGEFRSRVVALAGLAISGFIFFLGGVVVGKIDDLGLCCKDVYRQPTSDDIAAAKSLGFNYRALIMGGYKERADKLLFNTANETALAWKKTEFWGEVFSGVFTGISLALIWWFASKKASDTRDWEESSDEGKSDVDE